MSKEETGIKIITSNKKAHFNYFLSEFTECGLVLVGTEIKSLRIHGCSHDPLRARKLLLHKKEIRWFDDKLKRDGYTIVPTRVYLKRGKAKIEIALAKGKKLYDKRETIKQRDIKRSIRNGED